MTVRPRAEGSLAGLAARGVLWTGGGQATRQVVQICTQLALVRLLFPEDFGLMGMAMFFVGIGQLLADFGIGSAIVQAQSHHKKVLSSCFWANLAVGVLLALIVLACSPFVGRFYGRPEVNPIVAVLSVNLILAALQVVPSALLYRDMNFSDLARAQVVGTLAGSACAIGLAWSGVGTWALVAQPLVGTTATLLVSWRSTRWLPSFEFDLRSLAPLLRFSSSLLATNLVGYANRNVDAMLIGRYVGAISLGHYSMAIQIMLYPLQQVSSAIVKVLFPTLVRISDDLPRLRSAYLRANATISLLTFPLMAGLFVLASDFVQVVFGLPWADMTPVLRILSLVGMIQSIGTTMGVIYMATGRTDLALRTTLITTPFVLMSFVAGLPWGITGVAVAYTTVTVGIFFYTGSVALGLIALPMRTFLVALRGSAVSSCVMATAVFAFLQLVEHWPSVWRLSAGVAIGAGIYVMASVWLNRPQLMDIVRTLQSLRQSR